MRYALFPSATPTRSAAASRGQSSPRRTGPLARIIVVTPHCEQASAYRTEDGQIQFGIPRVESVRGPQVDQVVGRDGGDKQVVQGPGDDQHTGHVQQDQGAH
jgi:hypothetical protein